VAICFVCDLEQAAEVGRRQLRNKDIGGNADNTLKLQAAK
jgi:hypothetical protein